MRGTSMPDTNELVNHMEETTRCANPGIEAPAEAVRR